jgi:ATP-dependent RNA helicase DDX47/RRP3
VHRANTTVDTLKQLFVFVPFAQMLAYMHVYLARIETGSHIIVFCPSAVVVHKVTLSLRVLGHRALPLMGRMSQENRQRALQQFKEGKVRILVCTDLAQRGLDIAHTDVVVNYSLPLAAKEYIHRVGRTARAGSHGKAVNFITQYDILALQSIEATTGVKMEELQVPEDAVQAVAQRVAEAELEAAREVKEQQRIDEAEKQHQEMAAPSGPSRRRQSASTMGADDANHGKANFGVTRMRRENEEKFATTTKQQRQTLQQKRREAVRK